MALAPYIEWSQFPNAGPELPGDIIVGLRAGVNVQVTLGPAALEWNVVTGTTQDCSVKNGYIPTNVALTTFNLPLSAVAGDIVAIQGYGSGLWVVQAGVGVTVQIGNTASSIGGTVAAANRWDSIQLICLVNSGSVWGLYAPVSSAYTIL